MSKQYESIISTSIAAEEKEATQQTSFAKRYSPNLRGFKKPALLAMQSAIKKGTLEDLKEAIKNGAKPKEIMYDPHQLFMGETYETPLTLAVSFRRVEIVKYLIDEVKVDVNQLDSLGQTPIAVIHGLRYGLLLSAESDKNLNLDDFNKIQQIIDFLIKKGADINIQDRNGDSAASWISEQEKKLNELLTKFHIDPKIPDVLVKLSEQIKLSAKNKDESWSRSFKHYSRSHERNVSIYY